MQQNIKQQVIGQLLADYHFKEKGEWLQQGHCPACSKKELYTHRENPWIIKCGRENKCAYTDQVKNLYPSLFTQFNQRYLPSQENPTATADAYLQYARGFDFNKIRGWYEQGKFWHPHANKGTATVRFYLNQNRDIYMERLIEEVVITQEGEKTTRKAHFKGSHSGLWWQPPTLKINEGDAIWLVEGCLDAIALNLNGQKALAILSCTNYPSKLFEQYNNQSITWVWALDNDAAGKRYCKKWSQKAKACGLRVGAAQINKVAGKMDWNDCHLSNRLTKHHREQYLDNGSLLVAQNPMEKALLLWQKQSTGGFCFDFANRMYWFELDLEKYNKAYENLSDSDDSKPEKDLRARAAEQSGSLTEIANCKPSFLYFQSNKVTDESWYYCRVDFPHQGKAVKNTFTGSQVCAASEFKKRLLSIAPGGLFSGTSRQLDWLVKNNLHNIKVVDTIDFIGYSKEHKAYVFNEVAIANGKVYPINEEDFYEIGPLAIKSLNQSFVLSLGNQSDYQKTWPQWVYQGFGAKGLVAISFWLGCLFAEQIRKIHKSFPFLEIVGEAGAGKTTLIEFMWKLLGKADEEGFDPSKSSFAGVSRKLSQVSNLPVVLIEADREEEGSRARKFDWDELKTAYNGRASRTRGVKNSGNETYEPPFRGAIVISQNAEVKASEAILQRIIHLNFDKSCHNAKTKLATDKLNNLTVESLSFFLKKTLRNEAKILAIIEQFAPAYEQELLNQPEINSVRIAKNHGQLMALAKALASTFHFDEPILDEILHCIREIAVQRQRAIVADHPVVQQFWEIYDYLSSDIKPLVNHSKNKQLIAINLNHFIKVASEHKQQLPLLTELKRHLKNSKQHPFYAIKPVSSAIESYQDEWGNYYKPKSVKCWIFLAEP